MSKVLFDKVCLRYRLPSSSLKSVAASYIIAADNLNFELNEGDRVGVIGRNGSGKSTLLSLMSGDILPNSGRIVINGERLSLINQSVGLEPRATLNENALIRGYAYSLNGATLNEFVESVLNSSGLISRRNSPLNTLSTGMSGRFNIALNTQVVKPITILDEWIGTLNISGSDGSAMLNRLATDADIVVIASHNETLIKKLCNRVLLIEQGTLIYDGFDIHKGLNALSEIMKIDPDSALSVQEVKLKLNETGGLAIDGVAKSVCSQRKKHSISMPLKNNINKQNVHFLNMGRVKVTALSRSISEIESSDYNFIFHPITTRLKDIQAGELIVILYCDPLNRFVNSFYSRKNKGGLGINAPWSFQEKKAFMEFETPAEILSGVIDHNKEKQCKALSALRNIEHLSRGYCWYLDGRAALLNREEDILMIENSDDVESLVLAMKKNIQVNLNVSEFKKEMRWFDDRVTPISGLEKKIFNDVFYEDIELYEFLENKVCKS